MTDWAGEIGSLLDALSSVQAELLATIQAKRQAMIDGDLEEIERLGAAEIAVGEHLEEVAQRRERLLKLAGKQGLPANDLRTLARSVAGNAPATNKARFDSAAQEFKLLQHECVTNFVLAQRSWLHVSQLLQIVATGGRTKPTYGQRESPLSRGSLVDHAA